MRSPFILVAHLLVVVPPQNFIRADSLAFWLGRPNVGIGAQRANTALGW
jgi:hypothetical protein